MKEEQTDAREVTAMLEALIGSEASRGGVAMLRHATLAQLSSACLQVVRPPVSEHWQVGPSAAWNQS